MSSASPPDSPSSPTPPSPSLSNNSSPSPSSSHPLLRHRLLHPLPNLHCHRTPPLQTPAKSQFSSPPSQELSSSSCPFQISIATGLLPSKPQRSPHFHPLLVGDYHLRLVPSKSPLPPDSSPPPLAKSQSSPPPPHNSDSPPPPSSNSSPPPSKGNDNNNNNNNSSPPPPPKSSHHSLPPR